MKYGYFDNQSREYVITRPDVPASWTNYLGVRDLCTVISHNAGGYSYYKSPQHNRITRFRANAVPLDRPGHYVYLRDTESGDYWSISWQPVAKSLEAASYECRHGLTYSKFRCEYAGIEAEKTLFVPIDDDVELWDVRIKNASDRTRKLSVQSYLEFSFGPVTVDNQNFQMSLYCAGSSYRDGVVLYDLFYNPTPAGSYFHAANFVPDSFDCLRDSFIGSYRDESNPVAVERGRGSNSQGLTGNHCGSLQKDVTLAPGEEVRLVFMLGVGNESVARQVRERYTQPAAVDAAFQKLRELWNDKLARFSCETPHEGLDTMVNIWNLYQSEMCLTWSKFATFIEVGGRSGLGYRDAAQDAMAVPHTNPERTRAHLIHLLRAETQAGYGLHLFDPEWFEPKDPHAVAYESPTVVPTPSREDVVHGLEDTCSDDALWLVPAICRYVIETGDVGFFDEQVTYADSGEGSVYEHMQRVLDFSAKHVGQTGICKGLRADWNDCLNLGGGESALVSFLHYWAVQQFVDAALHLGRHDDARRYASLAEKVKLACEAQLWDGEWYIRGITKSGAKVGTHTQREGQVHLESNTWAVVSGVASAERGRACLEAIDEHLFSEWGIHLNAPSFVTPNKDIGFVTRVYPGVKENGAIFSHPNPWAWIAAAKLGQGDLAMKWIDALLPYNQNDKIEIRESEPYSYCQFVMGRDHAAHGKARHPWQTGTAGWAYQALTNWILGVRPGFNGLTVDPCIPTSWPGFTVTRRFRGATYRIQVRNPSGVSKGVKSVTLDGQPTRFPIPAQPEGSEHELVVEMG